MRLAGRRAVVLLQLIILAFSSTICFTGCKLPLSEYVSGPQAIPIFAEIFTIEWDYPEDQISSLPSSINHYNVYYRSIFEDEWIFLSNTNGPATRLITSKSYFKSSGNYVIGVEGVMNNDRTTDLIQSIEFDSYPLGGWYIVIQD